LLCVTRKLHGLSPQLRSWITHEDGILSGR
jgi:hypothetical protein